MTQTVISKNLALVTVTPSKKGAEPAAPKAANHLAVIDCSGSMSGELGRIRDQLKRRLPTLLGPEDTFSLIWFSGRGESGVLLEAEPVATLKDLQKVNQALDRWLRPVGLTGFKEPLEKAADLAEKLSKNGKPVALFFMSDGCDNQWGQGEILKAVEKAGGKVASATFVEYGYYADRPTLTRMAEKCGGSLIFAEGFDAYGPQFEAAMQRRPAGGKRVRLRIEGDAVGGFVYALAQGELTTYAVEGGYAEVPEGTTVHYLAPTGGKPAAGKPADEVLGPLYAALSLYAGRMQSEVVLALLGALGDVALVEEFGGCFGKQRYSAFQENAKKAALGQGRYDKGYKANAIPPEDAFTVLDLLTLLAEDDGNRVLLDHPDFRYRRIGRASVDAQENLSKDEQAEVDRLTAEMAKAGKDAKKVAELAAQIAAISGKAPGLKFVPDVVTDGYPITNLVYNEERPNVSIQVRKTGRVDLSERLPTEINAAGVNAQFDTFIFRAYTIVKDGIVNVDALPVRVTRETADKLGKLLPPEARPVKLTMTDQWVEGTIRLDKLPVVNRQMIKEASATTLFQMEWDLTKARATQKVIKGYRDERKPEGKTSGLFEAKYGKDAALWLKEQGITDYSGFNPKTTQAEAVDFYMSRELAVSLKGFSSLPTLAKAKEAKAKGGKVTPSNQVMFEAIAEVETFLADAAKKKLTDAQIDAWLAKRADESVSWVRDLLRLKARQVFTVIVGQVWFKEFSSLDQNTMTLDLDGQKIEGKVEMVEKKVLI